MTHFDAIVVGSGIAGLFTSLRLSEHGTVALVSKAGLSDSNTRFAQGGIAAVMFEDDSIESHIADTLGAGAGLCDAEAVRILCSEGPERIADLMRMGLAFDRQGDQLARGLEAAHSAGRVLHAGGDATGLHVVRVLEAAIRSNPRIHIFEHRFLTDLLLEDGVASGVRLLGDEKLFSPTVVLATGGVGQLYLHTTNPSVATGDGVAAAFRAGAAIANAEFVQFHPTALATPESFLISEAVRGEGAVLRNVNGERFVDELQPRDVVARAMAAEMAQQNGVPVFLDATALEGRFLAKRFPSIHAACQGVGFDWTKTLIPVTPAAHYWMGGVWTDLRGRTTLQGLYACGEAASTGVHGANRLASNSLLEGLVFGARVADAVRSNLSWPADSTGPIPCMHPDSVEVCGEKSSNSLVPGRHELRRLMWDNAGLVRDRHGLEFAVKQLACWEMPVGSNSSRDEWELHNLLTIGTLIATSALARTESRGGHFRSDHPIALDEYAQRRSIRSC